jgi:hypothetical protein
MSIRRNLLAAALLMAVTACSKPRTVHYTYSQTKVTDEQILFHMEQLRGTDGVVTVEALRDTTGSARITVVLKESNREPGMATLRKLGYERSGD